MGLSRRQVLAGAVALPLTAVARPLPAAPREKLNAKPEKAGPLLDIHIHLFGVGDGGSGCRMAKETREGPAFKLLSERLHLRGRAKTLDEAYVLALAEQLSGSGLQRGVILAQDAVYDRQGKPDWNRTTVYVPNDYLLRTVARFPRWMIPCVSINPNRRDALDELDRCRQQGARILKIHPPIQGADLADKKHTAFFRRCAETHSLVMAHTGHEHATTIFSADLANPKRLTLALEQGCTVVACHCGTGSSLDRPDMLPDLLAMIRRHKNLWGDTAILGVRPRDFRRLRDDELARTRLLHGSDFPFIPLPLAFAHELAPAEVLRLQAIANTLDRDLALKEALGVGRDSARRAYGLVAGVVEGLDKPAPQRD